MSFFRSFLALSASCVSSIVLGAGVLFYGHFLESCWVEETHRELMAKHWQGKPLRLAVIADLHARPGDGEYIDSLVQRTLAARPDVVLLLGDYINKPPYENSMKLETLARHLAPLGQFPCFAVLGNHDCLHGEDAVRAMLHGFGAKVVEGQIHALDIGGDTLHLSGVRCLDHYKKAENMCPPPQGGRATYLLLSHSPSVVHDACEGTTAVLAGHTHGGQICLPGGIPLKVDRRVPWELVLGINHKGNFPLYVSRGLGMSMAPLRLFCRPELLFVELRGVPQP